MPTIFAREDRAGGRDLGKVVEGGVIVAGNGDETVGFVAVGGNHAAATDEPKSLEHQGPAQLGAEPCEAIPLCESAPGVPE